LAMIAGVVKIPTPTTFDTISAMASLMLRVCRSWGRVEGREEPHAVTATAG
jgi:hypothetical protein